MDKADDYIFSSLSVVFTPSTGYDNLQVEVGLIADEIHELDEGFVVLAQFEFTTDSDRSTFQNAIGQNATLVHIINDDGTYISKRYVYLAYVMSIFSVILFEFENATYEVDEDVGELDVTFQKSGGIQSEVILTVSVDAFYGLTKGFAATNTFWYNTWTTVTMIHYQLS